ncbi:unannotated protein [freshwater metagenome]|uniref:Unannotated protein n=1 Tax=freshwater metagenome TaxID=449393 RepID=A0A6J7BVK1_9ZZZZ
MASGPTFWMLWPPKVISPCRAMTPLMARMVVVFPAPFAPSITTISPSLTSRSIPSSTFSGP